LLAWAPEATTAPQLGELAAAGKAAEPVTVLARQREILDALKINGPHVTAQTLWSPDGADRAA
jgi:hypothetical protein